MINMNVQIMDVMFVSMTTWQHGVLIWVKHLNVLGAHSLINACANLQSMGMAFRLLIKQALDDATYCNHQCQSYRCVRCNALRQVIHLHYKCHLDLKGTYGLDFVVQKKWQVFLCFYACHLLILCCKCFVQKLNVMAPMEINANTCRHEDTYNLDCTRVCP